MSATHLSTEPDELNDFLQRWQREVCLTRSVLLLESDRLPSTDPKQQAALLHLIELAQFPAIISNRDRFYSPQRPLITFDVPSLSYSEQLALWHLHLDSTATELNGKVEVLATQFNLSATTIQAACQQFTHSKFQLQNARGRFPNASARTEIWQRIFGPNMPSLGLDFQKLGQLNVAGGNIRNIAINAAFLAADADEPVMMKHILQGTQREYLKLKKLLTDEEITGWTEE